MTDIYLISSESKEADLIQWNSDISKNHTNTQALNRRHSAVIAELEPGYGLTISIYDIDPYFGNQKVKHRRPADTWIRVMVLERIETEKRLLEDIDLGDYVYL